MQEQDNHQQSVSIKRYIIIFSIFYAGICVLLQVALFTFDADGGSGSSIGILIGASMGTASKFVDEQKRPPSKSEANLLAWFSVLSSIIVSVVLAAIIFIYYMGLEAINELTMILSEIPMLAWIIIAVVTVLLSYGVTLVGYTWYAKKHHEARKKKELKNLKV